MQRPDADALRRLVRLHDVGSSDQGTPEGEDWADVVESVTGWVDEVAALDGRSTAGVAAEADPGERSWHEPADDPHNSIVHWCSVPPSTDTTGLLDGVSVGVKDVIPVAHVPMTGGSRALENFVPAHDATVVTRLRKAGGSVTAKTNNDELATSGTGTTQPRRPIRNPHDPERAAGGSSGGSAVAVATGAVDLALGTDTAGSARLPAAHCGTVGFKPSYGLVPLTGVVEYAYSLDHVGLLGPTVAAVVRGCEAIAGQDELDPASVHAKVHDDYRPTGFVEALHQAATVDSLSVGLIEEGLWDEVDPEVEAQTEAALERADAHDASVGTVSLDGFRAASAANKLLGYVELALSWISRGWARHRGVHGGPASVPRTVLHRLRASSDRLGAHHWQKLLTGLYLVDHLDVEVISAVAGVRQDLSRSLREAFRTYDVLVTPTRPTTAPRLDEQGPDVDHTRNTRPFNLVGHPAISLPNGTVDGLPVGLQLVGPMHGDRELLRVSAAWEAVLE